MGKVVHGVITTIVGLAGLAMFFLLSIEIPGVSGAPFLGLGAAACAAASFVPPRQVPRWILTAVAAFLLVSLLSLIGLAFQALAMFS